MMMRPPIRIRKMTTGWGTTLPTRSTALTKRCIASSAFSLTFDNECLPLAGGIRSIHRDTAAD
ncbi:hypothetical protein ACH79_20225 [Bradyrhizobium sp. CCBAU 051011]|nr:hypothetical protein ACH79_20225 [Bradyrhizobium sp. CCBAU 051011]